MTGTNTGWGSRTTAEPIYEQLLREADEGIRRSVLAGQSSQPNAPHPTPSPGPSWTGTSTPPPGLPGRGY